MATQPTIGTTGSGGPRWVAIWLLAFALATPLAWSSVAFVYFGMLAAGRPLTFAHSMVAGLPEWYVWAGLTPLVFSLGRARSPGAAAVDCRGALSSGGRHRWWPWSISRW